VRTEALLKAVNDALVKDGTREQQLDLNSRSRKERLSLHNADVRNSEVDHHPSPAQYLGKDSFPEQDLLYSCEETSL